MRRISAYSSAAILLLAFGLRVYHLAFQASMSDDALGLTLAQHNPLELFSLTATEPFPATFYVTLSLWAKAAGTTEYAGRFYSLLFSMLAVAAMYRAGSRMLSRRVGLVAAFLMAINPMDIYFAQEVRMYTMVTLFALGSSILAYELLAGRSKPWLAYALVSLAGVMTHAFALFVLLAQSVAALVAGPRAWRWLRWWTLCQLGVVAVFGVWVALVARNLQAYSNALVSAPMLPGLLWRLFTAFALGFSPAAGLGIALPGLLVGLVAVGVAWLSLVPSPSGRGQVRGVVDPLPGPLPLRRARVTGVAPAGIFLVSWLLVPPVAVWLIGFVRPAFYERYLVVCLPAALLLAATGIVGLEHALRHLRTWARAAGPALAGAALLVVAGASGVQLRAYYGTVVYATRDEMRALASYVSSVRQPVVVTNVAASDPLYGYYLPSSLPLASTQDMAQPPSTLKQLAGQHDVIWFLPYGDSPRQRQALDWLTANAYPAGSRWFGNAQVYGFASPSESPALAPAGVTFGDQVRLVEAGVPSSVRGGDPIEVALRWQAIVRPRANYSVFVHLLDGSGGTVAQHDGWPAGGARPTSGWQPGEVVDDHHALLTAMGTPPGRYRLEVGLYDGAGVRLSIDGGQTSALIGAVQVSPG